MHHLNRGLVALGTLALAGATAFLWSAPSGAQSTEPIVVQFTTVGSASFDVPAGVQCLAVDAIGAGGGRHCERRHSRHGW